MTTQITNGELAITDFASIILNATHDTISASLPIDRAKMENMCLILEHPKYLEEITFTSPLNPDNTHRLENEISDTLVWFFGLSADLKRLERVVLPMEFLRGIERIFKSLSRLRSLKSLALTTPSSYDYLSSPYRDALDSAIRRGIESLHWLQEVTLPADMLTERLAEALDQRFDASVSSYDETTVRYYKIRRD